ncbi:tRNA lysidine(34) synthetase TilS [Ancylothrix sp. C2]|uniref:tRNA lysidine(34) synthetase TilS n=1 Tax=Ancylothrix sp. D3o TaxID=2953691 RepID=UPI0021BB2F8E|nr:tRNA lysidine(34) synthetase TilS [Ancylothrix sp. D3o]MCT7951038.1 tRNA lysidine(34) synthetase TilS [Ancylothrix sp. D3o]
MSWTSLHAQIHRTLKTRQLLPRNSRILVAVSGGQDSLCLLQMLLDLQPKWNWDLAIAHCDHRWRIDSAANAEYVAELAKNLQVSFFLEVAQQIPKTEAAARSWRYQALGAICTKNNYNLIVTGHTCTDRAETLLYNLMRGSGAEGLQALSWKRSMPVLSDLENKIDLVRPLLEVSRVQTGQFCQENNIKVWEDSTNQDTNYTRNRIRLELLPLLETFNPQVEKHLCQTAELLRADVEYLEQQCGDFYEKAIVQKSDDVEFLSKIAINRRLLKTAHLAIQRRVIHRLLVEILPTAPNFEQVEKLTALITAPNRSRSDPFPGGSYAEVCGEWIEIRQI